MIIILLIQMAAIIAPIVARDEAESMLIKSANRTIQVRLTLTLLGQTQPDQTEIEPDPIQFKPDPNIPDRAQIRLDQIQT